MDIIKFGLISLGPRTCGTQNVIDVTFTKPDRSRKILSRSLDNFLIIVLQTQKVHTNERRASHIHRRK